MSTRPKLIWSHLYSRCLVIEAHQRAHMLPTECVDPETTACKLIMYMLGNKINMASLGNYVIMQKNDLFLMIVQLLKF